MIKSYPFEDGFYYYAKKDISFGGNVQVSGDYRFDLVPDGPIIDNRQSYYIYDKWNQLGLLNQGFSAGQEISIQGSMQGSNGNFEVLEVEESVDAYFSSEAQNTIISALELTELAGGWYRSSWFFIPNKGEVSELDKSLNYLIEGSNWIYNTLLGWLFINLDNSYGKNFWFYMPQFSNSRSEGDGVWLPVVVAGAIEEHEELGANGTSLCAFPCATSPVEAVPGLWPGDAQEGVLCVLSKEPFDVTLEPGTKVGEIRPATVQTRVCQSCGGQDTDAWITEPGMPTCEDCGAYVVAGPSACRMCGSRSGDRAAGSSPARRPWRMRARPAASQAAILAAIPAARRRMGC